MPVVLKPVPPLIRKLVELLGSRYCLRIKVYPYTVLLVVLAMYSLMCLQEYNQVESLPPIVTRTITKDARRESSARLSMLRSAAEDFLGGNGKVDRDVEVDGYEAQGKLRYLVMYSGPTAKRRKVTKRPGFLGFNFDAPPRGRHNIYADNFDFFLKYGLHNSSQTVHVDFVLVLTEESLPEWDDKIKALNMPNVRVLLRDPDCYDMQSFIVALQVVDYRQYDRIIGVNCGLRGPFVPPYVRHIMPWTVMLGSLIDDDVKLAGLSQNRNGNPWKAHQRHVQSMIWVTDRVGLSVILAAGCMFDCSVQIPGRVMGRDYLIQRYEIGMSVAIKQANYSLRAWNNFQINKQYCKDYKSVKSPDRKAYPYGPELQEEWSKKGYFGTASPYEMMFVKYTRDLRVHKNDMDQSKAEKLAECSREDQERNLEFYDHWHAKYVAPIGYVTEPEW